jgi:hypothetical protein
MSVCKRSTSPSYAVNLSQTAILIFFDRMGIAIYDANDNSIQVEQFDDDAENSVLEECELLIQIMGKF